MALLDMRSNSELNDVPHLRAAPVGTLQACHTPTAGRRLEHQFARYRTAMQWHAYSPCPRGCAHLLHTGRKPPPLKCEFLSCAANAAPAVPWCSHALCGYAMCNYVMHAPFSGPSARALRRGCVGLARVSVRHETGMRELGVTKPPRRSRAGRGQADQPRPCDRDAPRCREY